MRMSRLLLRTLREDPADADTAGHALLVRGGYVRRLASGVYTFLPLGLAGAAQALEPSSARSSTPPACRSC